MTVDEAIEELKKYPGGTEVSALKLEFVKGATRRDPIQAAKLLLEPHGFLVYASGQQSAQSDYLGFAPG